MACPISQMPVRFIADLPLYETEKLYSMSGPELVPDGDFPLTNLRFAMRQIQLHNLRDCQEDLSFETHGFKYLNYTSTAHPENFPDQIPAYCEEMIALLRRHVQASRYLCYNFKIRRPFDPNQQINTQGLTGPALPDTYLEAAHVDHTRYGGWERISRHLTRAEKDTYSDGSWRIRVWNLWKPTVAIVEDNALALCDPVTVDEEDLLPCDQIGPESSGPPGEIYYIRPSSNQCWYWLPCQLEDELYLFLSWDSHPPGGKLNFCPHAAFKDPSVHEPAQRRESVEVRVVTFSKLD